MTKHKNKEVNLFGEDGKEEELDATLSERMPVGAVRYGFQFEGESDRLCDLRFCTSTQENVVETIDNVEQEIESWVDEIRHDQQPAMTKKEFKKDYGEAMVFAIVRIK